ncbi:hypothetical protein CPB83DRAFT_881992 [Crepidotus variabilis]|uniref:AAA+ ATPase domain-containing protein n=1 Tax=Crepidotus variabilis TaxID=179855 RepID=A0A9P6JRZ4_9AGAR|nr:hypothetical protein CPB83DRAFT_881992 [Crepidotus variabilis]
MALHDPQEQQPIHFFDGVGGNVNIHDGQFVGVVNNNSSAKSTGVPWLDYLLSHCAPDALFDSKARQDPPKCAPRTREAIQKEILDWINLHTQSGLVMWLHGSAGSGKSAIAQTIAELLNDQKTPSASFFFSRISGSPTRVDGDRLLPTIIYQLCLLLPEYRDTVKRKLQKDPTIFEKSHGAQMTTLVTKVLQQFSFRRILREFYNGRPVPLVIIIDGLDECRDPQMQCKLLSVIADASASIRRRPVRFFIASRPETHITRIFDQHPNFQHLRLRRINLDDDPDASMAILVFLRQEFQKIHQTHPLGIHLEPSWPDQDIIDFLVSKSSPQFILASTAMSYVGSPKHRPTERLTAVMNVLSAPTFPLDDQPLQRMDALYTFIFSGVDKDRRDIVQAILGIIHLSSLREYHLPPPVMSFLEESLGLSPGDIYLYLEPLMSVLYLPKDPEQPVKSTHASLYDFLLNPARSHNLVLDLIYARAGLIGYYFLNDVEMVHVLLKDPAVQSVSITPRMIEGAFITQADRDFPAFGSRDGDLIRKAHFFFTLVELGFGIIIDHAPQETQYSPLSSYFMSRGLLSLPASDVPTCSLSPIQKTKYTLYRRGCRYLLESEHKDLIDTFRGPMTNMNHQCLFYLLMTYITTYELQILNRWQLEIFEAVGHELQAINWSREKLETRDLCEALAKTVLKWLGLNKSREAHRLKQLWGQISLDDQPP